MPKRSGYEVSAFVKSHPSLQGIPVLLLAGAFEPVDEAKAKDARCDGVLVKPLEPQHVIARVRELMGAAKTTSTQSLVNVAGEVPPVEPSGGMQRPTRQDLAAVPDDLMADFGGQDLLPREDLLPQIEDTEPPAQPMILDNSLDDYFDKLDEAFATINSPARAASPHAEGDLDSFDEPPVLETATPSMESLDPFAGLDPVPNEESAAVPNA
jgi:hypothetical protein